MTPLQREIIDHLIQDFRSRPGNRLVSRCCAAIVSDTYEAEHARAIALEAKVRDLEGELSRFDELAARRFAPRPEYEAALIACLDLTTPAGRRELAYLAALRWGHGSAEVERDVALRIAETARLVRDHRESPAVWTLWVSIEPEQHLNLWEADSSEELSAEQAASDLRAEFWDIR